jgi:hypothetical protein
LVWFQPAALTATARHQQLISSMAIKKAQSMHATAGCEQKEGEQQQRGASHTGMAAFLSVSGGSSPKAAGRGGGGQQGGHRRRPSGPSTAAIR